MYNFVFMNNKKSNILLIEDDLSLGQTISELLTLHDFNVKWCKNGLEGFNYLQTKIPDIIVCDLMMPIMSGEELFLKIRKFNRFNDVPFIIITADISFEMKIKQLENGVNDFISKPFKIQELLLKVKNFINYREIVINKKSNDIYNNIANTKPRKKDFFSLIDEILVQNINSDISIDKLASEVFVSKSTLDKKIRRLKKVNTSTYIREFRLQYAIKLIEEGEENVKDLSNSCGFNSLSYFSISFKKYTGLSPKDYIKKFQSNS